MKSKKFEDILRPFALHFSAMYTDITIMTDEQLADLVAACRRVRNDNCGWHIFAAGKHLLPEAFAEQARRVREAKEKRSSQTVSGESK